MKILSIIYLVLFSILIGIVFTNFQPKINRIQIDIEKIDIWNTIYVDVKTIENILEIRIYRGLATPLERKYNITIIVDNIKIFSQTRNIAPGQTIEIGINIPTKTSKIKILINNKLVKTP